jgi:hypothetical protein
MDRNSNIACAPKGIAPFETVGATELETLVSVALPLLIMGATTDKNDPKRQRFQGTEENESARRAGVNKLNEGI